MTGLGNLTGQADHGGPAVYFIAAATENGGDNEEEEDDREFWNLMKDPAVSEAKMNRAIKRMVAEARDGGGGGGSNDCDLSSSGGLSSSDRSSPVGMAMEVASPRTRLPRQDEAGDVDFTVTSLGCFLDLLFEKVPRIRMSKKCLIFCFFGTSWKIALNLCICTGLHSR